MLEKVRKPLSIKSFAAYIIFGMICLTFVFVGLQGGNVGLSTGGAAAVVNGSIIPISDYQKQVARTEKQYSMFFKDMSPQRRRDQSRMIRQRVLNELIRSEATAQSAMELGLVATSSEILDYITKMEVFHEEEQFQPTKYDLLLKANGYNPHIFENNIRKDLLSSKLKVGFTQALLGSPLEAQRQTQLKQSEMNLKFISFDKEKLTKNYKIPAKELESFMKNSLDLVQKYYDENDSEFTSEEKVKAKHILVKAPPDDKEAQAKALKKIKAIAKRAETEDFGKLAAETSEDPGSKKKNGDLGYFSRGKMVPEFEKVAFSSPIDEISSPVQTNYGYHLIKVEGKTGGKKKEFKSVKKEIAEKLIRKESVPKDIESLKENFKSEDLAVTKKAIKNLTKRYELKWRETGKFSVDSENIPKMGRGEPFYKALFRLSPTKGETLKELFEVDGQYYIVKLLIINKAKENNTNKNTDFEMRFRQAQRTGEEALNLWLNDWEKNAHIQKNQRLVVGN